MGGACPFAFLRSPSPMRPPARRSFVRNGCRRHSSNIISMMAAPCTGSYGPNLTAIHTIIPGVSRRAFSRADMWKRFLRSSRTAAGTARSSSGCRAPATGSKQAISTASSVCPKGKAGRSSGPDRTNARRCFGVSARPFSIEPGMPDAGIIIGRLGRANERLDAGLRVPLCRATQRAEDAMAWQMLRVAELADHS